MNRQTIDPVLRAAVRAELEQLPGRARGASNRPRIVPRSQRTWRTSLVTVGTAVVVVGCSVAAIQYSQPRTTRPADGPQGQATAADVTFAGPQSEAARHERDLRTFLVASGWGHATSDRLAVDAVLASPELRYDSTPTDSHRFVVQGSAEGGADTEGEAGAGWFRYGDLKGFYKTGEPLASEDNRVESLIMNCPGTGNYTWTLRGRTATDSQDRTLAQAVGRCGSTLTTFRYRLDKGTRTTSFTVKTDNDGGVYNAAIFRWVLTAT